MQKESCPATMVTIPLPLPCYPPRCRQSHPKPMYLQFWPGNPLLLVLLLQVLSTSFYYILWALFFFFFFFERRLERLPSSSFGAGCRFFIVASLKLEAFGGFNVPLGAFAHLKRLQCIQAL